MRNSWPAIIRMGGIRETSAVLREFGGLSNPVVPDDSPLECEACVDPGDLFGAPGGDLVEVPDAHGVEKLFELWPHTLDLLEIIALVATRRIQGFRLFFFRRQKESQTGLYD